MKLKSLLALALSGAVASLHAATVDVSGQITSNTTWIASNTYVLNGYVFVSNNATLTIEPGTVIKGKVSEAEAAAALVITRGAKINAVGTADKPIIFTSVLDELNGNLTEADTGLWGGLVILGNARINSRANGAAFSTPVEDQIEGFSVSSDQIPLITFGGTNDADSSGTIRYVSVRHGGAVIGVGNEINGVTLGGVGSGTVMEYVEVFANKDDGFEWFGGTMNARYLVSAFCNDESFDIDTGFRGNLQFLFSIQKDVGLDSGDRAIEWDGATSPLSATPKGDVTVANYTAIGIGTSLKPDGTAGRSNQMLSLGDNPTVKIYNSIFTNFAAGLQIASDIGDVAPDIKGNIFWSHIAANNTPAGLTVAGSVSYTSNYFSDAANSNSIVNPQLKAINYVKGAAILDPRPAAGSPALTGGVTLPAGLTATTYKGAFASPTGALWTNGWTKLSRDAYFTTDIGGGSGSGETVVNRGSPTKLTNIATRGMVGTGSGVMIAGFRIDGPQTQTLIIRAVGPTLANFGVTGALADPVLELYRSNADGTSTLVASNDNWSGEQAKNVSAEKAFPLADGSADAMLLVTLPPGNYTVQVSGKNGTTGVALVEVYEID